jgi:hypothetical protein
MLLDYDPKYSMQEGLKKAVENNLKWNERGVDSEISE